MKTPFEIKNGDIVWLCLSRSEAAQAKISWMKRSVVAHAYPIHQVFMVSWRPPFFLPVESEGEHYSEILIKSVDLAVYSESFKIVFQDAN